MSLSFIGFWHMKLNYLIVTLTRHCTESHLSSFLHQLMLPGLGNTPFMHGNSNLPPSDTFTLCMSSPTGSSAV